MILMTVSKRSANLSTLTLRAHFADKVVAGSQLGVLNDSETSLGACFKVDVLAPV